MNNLFKVDYLAKEKDLIKEVFSFKKYKAMPKFPAIVMSVVMLPLQIVSAFLAIMMFFPALLLKATVSIIQSLHGLVTDEGQKLKHATQLIVYFFSWPIIFLSYIFACVWYVHVVVLYLLLEAVSYIWTLGGFKFHAYIVDADEKSIEIDKKYKKLYLTIHIAVTLLVLVAIPLCLAVIAFARMFIDGCGSIVWPNADNGLVFWDLVQQAWTLLQGSFDAFIISIKLNFPKCYMVELVFTSLYALLVMSRPFSLTEKNAPVEEVNDKEEGEGEETQEEEPQSEEPIQVADEWRQEELQSEEPYEPYQSYEPWQQGEPQYEEPEEQ